MIVIVGFCTAIILGLILILMWMASHIECGVVGAVMSWWILEFEIGYGYRIWEHRDWSVFSVLFLELIFIYLVILFCRLEQPEPSCTRTLGN